MKNELAKKIEAILFYIAEPVTVDFLKKILEVSEEEILTALSELEETLINRGIKIVHQDNEIVLTTAPELSGLIEKIIKEERERDLGRAGIETLSIIAYKGFVSKKEIEYVRGVNSQYALRNLLLRGLIERKESKTDGRMVGYSVTLDTLRFLGLSDVSELPQYEEMNKELVVVEEDPETDATENNGE